MYFAKSTGGFYTIEIHGDAIPTGAVEITDELYHALLDGQSTGLVITSDADGVPYLAPAPPDAPPSALEQIRALEAQYADAQAKLTRQVILSQALDKAMTDPLAEGLTLEQVHAGLMLVNGGDNGYAGLFNLEQQVEALRAQL